MKLIVDGKYNIIGRGIVYTMSLKENGFSGYRTEFNKLMNQEVEIDGERYLVRGIEAFATLEHYVHDSIGLLVKQIL